MDSSRGAGSGGLDRSAPDGALRLEALFDPEPPDGVQEFDAYLPDDPGGGLIGAHTDSHGGSGGDGWVWLVDGELVRVVEATAAPVSPVEVLAGVPLPPAPDTGSGSKTDPGPRTDPAAVIGSILAELADLAILAADADPDTGPTTGAASTIGTTGAGGAGGSGVAGAGAAGVAGVGVFELGELIAGCQRVMSHTRALQAVLVAGLSSRPEMAPLPSGRRLGSVSARACTALELTDPLKVTSGQAERLVAESVQLVEDFPATHAALAAGRIDERRTRVILTELGRLDRDVASAVETAIIPRAPGMDPRQLRRAITRLIHELAPAAAEERRGCAEEGRYVRVTPAEDGMAWLEALIRAEDAAAIDTVLDAGAKTLKRRDAAAGDPHARTSDQRRADTLTHLAWTALADGRIGATHAAPADVDNADTGHTDAEHRTARAEPAGHASGECTDRDQADQADITGGGDGSRHATRAPTGTTDTAHAADTTGDTGQTNGTNETGGTGTSGSGGSPFGIPDDPDNSGSPRSPGDPSGPGSPADSDDSTGSGGAGGVGGLGELSLSTAHGRPVSVQVTVPLSTLIGLDEHPGELTGYGPIPAHVARHLSTSGLWQWVGTHDLTGEVLSHGRTRYTPTQDLTDHVILRDRTCRAPGCAAPAQKCDLDHTIYYPLGPTAACNLGLYCRKHHRAKHRTRWHVAQPHPGTFHWTSPTGRTATTTPEPIGPVGPTNRPPSDHPPDDPLQTGEPPPSAEEPRTSPPRAGDDVPPF